MIPSPFQVSAGLQQIGVPQATARQATVAAGRGLQKGAQFLGGPAALGLAGRYMPVLGGVAELASTGDVVSAGGSVAGGMGGAKLGAMLGAGLGPVGAGAGALIGSVVGSGAGSKIAKGAQNAVGSAIGMGSNQLERAGVIGPYGTMPGITPEMIRMQQQYGQVASQQMLNTNAGLLQQSERFREGELNRHMRAQNQLGQIQGGLAGMKIAGNITDRQLAEGGGNFRSMINAANPYANVSTGATVSI